MRKGDHFVEANKKDGEYTAANLRMASPEKCKHWIKKAMCEVSYGAEYHWYRCAFCGTDMGHVRCDPW